MLLIRELQHRPVREEIVFVEAKLYAEALEMIKQHKGSMIICYPANQREADTPIDIVMFCRHWITPKL